MRARSTQPPQRPPRSAGAAAPEPAGGDAPVAGPPLPVYALRERGEPAPPGVVDAVVAHLASPRAAGVVLDPAQRRYLGGSDADFVLAPPPWRAAAAGPPPPVAAAYPAGPPGLRGSDPPGGGPRGGGRVFIEGVLERLLRLLWREPPGPGRASPWVVARLRPLGIGPVATGLDPVSVARVDACLRENLRVGLDAEELARIAGYSRYHFFRLYRAATGTTPHERLMALRVERAQSLLASRPHVTVAAVAAACGFTDQSHMARRFRRVTGLTPTRWRKQHAGG